MNTDALVAALGADASAAVHRNRLDVMSEARRCGPRRVDEPLARRVIGRSAPAEVLDRATSGFDGPAAPPAGVDLDDDPRAIQRLLTRVTPVLPRSDRPGVDCTAIAEV